MVFSPDFEEIGYIEKTHGISGWLKVNLYKNSISKEVEFLFLEQHGQKVPFKIKEINKNSNLILMSNFTNPEEAQHVVGSGVFVIATEKSKPAAQGLLGYKVVDENGHFIGEITAYIKIPKNPLIEVKMKDREITLPLSEDLLLNTNHKTKTVTYQLPEGLLDL
jgi:16S rRNA processing protein RimM